jgi:hypothetical protein
MLYSSTWKRRFYGIFGILYERRLLGEVEPNCAVPKAFSKVKKWPLLVWSYFHFRNFRKGELYQAGPISILRISGRMNTTRQVLFASFGFQEGWTLPGRSYLHPSDFRKGELYQAGPICILRISGRVNSTRQFLLASFGFQECMNSTRQFLLASFGFQEGWTLPGRSY